MKEFMMIMKGGNHDGNAADWQRYIDCLSESGMFRGGSAFGKGVCVSGSDDSCECLTTGYMRFEAASIENILTLVAGNPVFESGGDVEVHELVLS